MAVHPQPTDSGPVLETGRITSLDLIRGVAVLGILLMNAVSFRFGHGPYFNLSAGGSESWLDWTVGILGEVFVDQKFMGVFSLLFGAGMVLFIDRASRRGRRAALLNLWRNALLLLIGVLHFLVWDGDVLIAYALSSVFLIALRKLPNWALISLGVAVFNLSVATAFLTQRLADTTDASLSGLWMPGEVSDQEVLGLVLVLGFFLRALGLILVGAGLYRTGFMDGALPPHDLSTRRCGRPCRRPPPCRRRRHHHRTERLLSRDSIHRPDTQYHWHDSFVPWIHEPRHPLEQPPRPLAQEAAARSRENGPHQLPHTDGARSACINNLVGQRRLCESKRPFGVCIRGLDPATVVVPGLAQPLPLWTR